jgi:hypothetical protein
MAIKSKGNQSNSKTRVEIIESRSLTLAEAGPKSVMQIAELSLAVACDVIRGAITANNANATASAIGKTLKAIEIQLKHGPKNTVHKMLGDGA